MSSMSTLLFISVFYVNIGFSFYSFSKNANKIKLAVKMLKKEFFVFFIDLSWDDYWYFKS